jgi:peptidoglycan-associated lipoprotein
MVRARISQLLLIASALAIAAGCTKPTTPNLPPPVPSSPAGDNTTIPVVPPPVTSDSGTRIEPVATPPTVAQPANVSPYDAMPLDEVNRAAVLKPVFFLYDSDQLDDAARQVLTENSQTLKKYARWVITVEGHCDERGSAEYNLALGDRRAQAARNYLVSLGVPTEQLRTVSYGKEFPFDPGHDESAWKTNRRAQFMVTAK